eukprot:358271-Chlamydomonas_euryale.AAC.2
MRISDEKQMPPTLGQLLPSSLSCFPPPPPPHLHRAPGIYLQAGVSTSFWAWAQPNCTALLTARPQAHFGRVCMCVKGGKVGSARIR